MPNDELYSDAIDELLELWEQIDPDPVDVFEDELAAKLGLYRGPGCTRDQWRRQRVRFIDNETEDGDLPDLSGGTSTSRNSDAAERSKLRGEENETRTAIG